MRKPTLKLYGDEEAYDVHDVMNYIDHKYASNCYDVLNSGLHYDKWCIMQGFGNIDPAGKKRRESNIWFAEYKKHPEGEATRPPLKTVLDRLDIVYDIYAHKMTTFEFCKDDFRLHSGTDFMTEFAERVVKEFGDQCKMGHDFDDR